MQPDYQRESGIGVLCHSEAMRLSLEDCGYTVLLEKEGLCGNQEGWTALYQPRPDLSAIHPSRYFPPKTQFRQVAFGSARQCVIAPYIL